MTCASVMNDLVEDFANSSRTVFRTSSSDEPQPIRRIAAVRIAACFVGAFMVFSQEVVCNSLLSELIPDRSQEFFSCPDIGLGFNPFRFHAIDDSQNAPALVRLCDDHLDRVRRGTVNMTDLGDVFDGI